MPSGVSVVTSRPGLYRLTCMIRGKRHSEYYRTAETGKKKLQSELQKAIDTFRERVNQGQNAVLLRWTLSAPCSQNLSALPQPKEKE